MTRTELFVPVLFSCDSPLENFTDKIFTHSKQTNNQNFDSMQISHLLLKSEKKNS